jgi:hypothetical protein
VYFNPQRFYAPPLAPTIGVIAGSGEVSFLLEFIFISCNSLGGYRYRESVEERQYHFGNIRNKF